LTHPLLEPKNGNRQQRKKQSEQIDPDELRRKLEAHLAEQKRQAELRRAKAIAKKEQGAYHHVPKVAAAAFERTATPVLMGGKETKKKSTHKLGHVALKHHVEENIRPASGSFNLRKTLAMDHAKKQRDLVGDRNQSQKTRHLEDAAKLDKERNARKVPQRTFGVDHLDIPQTGLYSRSLSTGHLNWEEDLDSNNPLSQNKPKANALFISTFIDRQDWAQRDEVPVEVHRSVKDRVSPFLRKTDSMWILKSRKEPKSDTILGMSRSAPTGDIKQKKTFLGLFKR
jgi:hypothetical protein